ncbi:MAG: hypothetical protein Q4C61_08590 [Lachnospiraceae bacterium]|nr:hypothetical protein [Lachnospiraceae bacterium]
MAKIVKTDTQEAALKVIKGNIKILSGINTAINAKEKDSRMIITTGKKKVSLAIEKPFCDNVLKEIRKKMVAQTEVLAKKNAIRLEKEEIAILENQEDGSVLQSDTEE